MIPVHSHGAGETIKILIKELKMEMLMGKKRPHKSLNKSCPLQADLFLSSHSILG